jgi:hypothetical protein
MPTTIDALPNVTEIHTNCPLCETALDPTNPVECPKCDWVLGYRRRQAQQVGTVRDNIALLLSVVPGAGHLYKGHRMLGIIFMTGTLVAIFASIVAATATALWGLLLLPFYWAGVMLHVYWLDDLADPATASVNPGISQR